MPIQNFKSTGLDAVALTVFASSKLTLFILGSSNQFSIKCYQKLGFFLSQLFFADMCINYKRKTRIFDSYKQISILQESTFDYTNTCHIMPTAPRGI